MSIWLDDQYINRMNVLFDKFKRVKPNLYNLRCPICGDSSKNKNKARGYFFIAGQEYRFSCHNCGASMKTKAFIKLVSPMLYDEYCLESYKEEQKYTPEVRKLEPKKNDDFIDIKRFKLKNFSEIDDSHPAKKYLLDRKIPDDKLDLLYYSPTFQKWVKSIDSSFVITKEHPRVVIPYFDEENSVFRFNSRAFGKESPRYQQTILDQSKPRIYGMERISKYLPMYVVEGQIDSLFLPNCVAVGTANYNVPWLDKFKDKTYIPDNQPRNHEVVAQIEPLITSGKRVCLWDQHYGKDINDMIKNGLTQKEVIDIIESCSVSGVQAILKFKQWRKD